MGGLCCSELRERIQPEILELIKQQRLNRLCEGSCFRKLGNRRRQGGHTHLNKQSDRSKSSVQCFLLKSIIPTHLQQDTFLNICWALPFCVFFCFSLPSSFVLREVLVLPPVSEPQGAALWRSGRVSPGGSAFWAAHRQEWVFRLQPSVSHWLSTVMALSVLCNHDYLRFEWGCLS